VKPLADCRLYAFVDTGYLRGRAPELVAQQLCEGGADLIQLRAKAATADEVRRLAERLLAVTEHAGAGVGLVINDHWGIAREIGAPLCHLGQEDFFARGFSHASQLLATPGDGAGAGTPMPAPDLRAHSPPRIGLSTHAPAQAERAVAAGAAYVAIGPVYGTPTKPAARPVTLEYVRWAAARLRLPWFAIGGINLGNLDDVLAAGATRICVVSAILNAPDAARACREFKERLLSSP
jgi:thiamine-phosphate pyrophosphorylase